MRSIVCSEDDRAGAVAHLLRAGRISESAWLLEQARAWFAVALEVAGPGQDRQPEIEALLALGRVNTRLGRLQEAGQLFQRGLTLAESELDNASAADACMGLGNIALEQARGATGARAWYSRGLLIRPRGGERAAGRGALPRPGRSLLPVRASGRSPATACARRGTCSAASTIRGGLARALSLQAVLSAGVGDTRDAITVLPRGAREGRPRPNPTPRLEVSIRINYARVLLETGSYLETEEELRRAEQVAIANNLIHELVQIYSLLGSAHGRQGDEVGFVFFEQAIELMAMLDHSPLEEAQVCYEYGVFENRVLRPDESRAYLERARSIFESMGASGGLERVEAELQRVSA